MDFFGFGGSGSTNESELKAIVPASVLVVGVVLLLD